MKSVQVCDGEGGFGRGGPSQGPPSQGPLLTSLHRLLLPLQFPKSNVVVNSVAAAAAAVYIFWKVRLRATEEGPAPRTLRPDWERAMRERMSHMPLEAAPGMAVCLNRTSTIFRPRNPSYTSSRC